MFIVDGCAGIAVLLIGAGIVGFIFLCLILAAIGSSGG